MRADSSEFPTTLWTFSENQSSRPKFNDIVAKTATIIAGDNAKIEKTKVIRRWSVDPPPLFLRLAKTLKTFSKINIPTTKIYKKSSTIIADSNSGLAESSVMLKAKKVIIDKSGPKKTTTKVAKLENKN